MSETTSKRPRAAAKEQTAEGVDRVDLGVIGGAMGYLLKRAQMAVFAEFNRNFAAEDIRPAQFSILVTIEGNPGLKQSQVSAALGIKRTNFVPLLDALEERGLVKRKPAAGDRRSYALHLTPKGAVLTKKLRAIWTEHENRVLSCIGAENREQLADWLTRIAEMGEIGEDGDESDAEAAAPVKPVRGRPKRAPET